MFLTSKKTLKHKMNLLIITYLNLIFIDLMRNFPHYDTSIQNNLCNNIIFLWIELKKTQNKLS